MCAHLDDNYTKFKWYKYSNYTLFICLLFQQVLRCALNLKSKIWFCACLKKTHFQYKCTYGAHIQYTYENHIRQTESGCERIPKLVGSWSKDWDAVIGAITTDTSTYFFNHFIKPCLDHFRKPRWGTIWRVGLVILFSVRDEMKGSCLASHCTVEARYDGTH